MALTDIVSEGGESSAAARGDIGTLVDILARDGMSNNLSIATLTEAQEIMVQDMWQRLGLDPANPLHETLAAASFGPVTLAKAGTDPETVTRSGANVVGDTATALDEIWRRMGLDAASPLSVGSTVITVGSITQTATGTPGSDITITRT